MLPCWLHGLRSYDPRQSLVSHLRVCAGADKSVVVSEGASALAGGGADESARVAMKNILVNVTARDIMKGIPYDAIQCPIAISLRRHRMGGRTTTCASSRKILLNGLTYFTPSAAAEFIQRFDAGIKMEPFRFVLTDPKEIQ